MRVAAVEALAGPVSLGFAVVRGEVVDVDAGGPAHFGGVRPGWKLLELDGQVVSDQAQVDAIAAAHRPGREVVAVFLNARREEQAVPIEVRRVRG
ncbi:MAG: PDZ domain-containing protein [Deltaproteobacteria bacterium]|nr:PDZ domain-containing protein [Deltaproteobacteria bacterium]